MSEYPTCGGHNFFSTDVWEAENSTDSGTFDLYSGTQESVNTFYAQLEKQTGLCEPYRLAREMGIDLTDPNRERVPSFTLGVAETSPLEMAGAYATFAGRGLACAQRPVTSIEDADGNLLRDYPENCHQVMSASTADAVNDILRGVQEPGGFGYSNGLALNQPSAGKTGTIQSNMAVWFMGYTPNLATAAMIAGANDDGTWVTLNGQVVGGSGIGEAFGSTVAGPMWGDAMHVIQQWLPDDDFTPPSGQDVAGVLTEIPDTGGMSVDQATLPARVARLRRRRWAATPPARTPRTPSPTRCPGRGSDVASGTTVTIYQSTGTPPPKPPKPPEAAAVAAAMATAVTVLGTATADGNGTATATASGNGGGDASARPRPSAQTHARRRWPTRAQAELRWRLTSAATAPPSARPRTCGVSTPITLPIAFMPSPATPSSAMVGGHQGLDLLRAELLGQVVGDHGRLGELLVGHRLPAAVRERRRGLAPLLALGGEDADDLVVAELARLLAGHLRVGDGGQHHPQGRGADLVARLHGGGQVTSQTVLEGAHAGHCPPCGTLDGCAHSTSPPAPWRRAGRSRVPH